MQLIFICYLLNEKQTIVNDEDQRQIMEKIMVFIKKCYI